VFALRDGTLERLGLEGREVSALHAGADGLLAGTYGDGLFRSTGESWEMQFSGQGVVIVQPSELLPPYNALGSNPTLQQRFGLGQAGGFQGNNIFGGR